MAKAKKKSVATVTLPVSAINSLRQLVDELSKEQSRLRGVIVDGLSARDHRIDALDEAICPRVAARLDGVEKRVGVRHSEHSFGVLGTFEEAIQRFGDRVAKIEHQPQGNSFGLLRDEVNELKHDVQRLKFKVVEKDLPTIKEVTGQIGGPRPAGYAKSKSNRLRAFEAELMANNIPSVFGLKLLALIDKVDGVDKSVG